MLLASAAQDAMDWSMEKKHCKDLFGMFRINYEEHVLTVRGQYFGDISRFEQV